MAAPQAYRPYQLCFMVLSILLGLGYLTTVPTPSSVAALVPGWVVALWAWTLLVTGVLALIGCVWRGHPLLGLGLERSALIGQTGALLIICGATLYAWTAGQLANFPLLGLGFLASWMVANLWRVWQILVLVRQLQRPVEDVP